MKRRLMRLNKSWRDLGVPRPQELDLFNSDKPRTRGSQVSCLTQELCLTVFIMLLRDSLFCDYVDSVVVVNLFRGSSR